jgi:nucleotide-binding universal stress UspA family protein
MVILKNILVATDFSEPSAVALAYGRDFARSYGATLHLLHVVEDVMIRYSPEMGMTSPMLMENLESRARRELEALVTDDDRATLKIMPVVLKSPTIPGGIVEFANGQKIDMVIVGTHGRSGMKQFLIGSVAEGVVRTAPCPVLTVRERERDFIAPDARVSSADAASQPDLRAGPEGR